ncbi:MAG: methyltransferase [Proteobacteria bacterium]|nr:methyltransferase [Pseudomonadota bacterium]
MTEWTRDTPASGLVITQPKQGFRYAADAFWLAGVALDGPTAKTAIDLGTGSGIVAFLLARTGMDVVGVDANARWAEAWRRSLAESESTVDFRVGDVLDLHAPPVDLVVCNPPYFMGHSGPVSPNPWKAAARTESTATLGDFVEAASRLLKPTGRAVFVVPRAREAELGSPLHPWRIHRIGSQRSIVELSPVPKTCETTTHPDRGDYVERLYRLASA